MSKQFTLGKNERLKSRKLIEQLFSEGKKFVIFPFRVLYIIDKKGNGLLQFGAGVSSKFFKKAADRNRVKRVMRESYRLQKKSLQEKLKEQDYQLNIFIIYTSKVLPEYKEMYTTMGMVLDKFCTMLIEKK